MEREMENWHDEVGILEAQVAAQHLLLQRLVQSHPQPDALLQQWRRLRADRFAETYALTADVRSSDWLLEQVQVFAEDWTAELVDVVVRKTSNLGDSTSTDLV